MFYGDQSHLPSVRCQVGSPVCIQPVHNSDHMASLLAYNGFHNSLSFLSPALLHLFQSLTVFSSATEIVPTSLYITTKRMEQESDICHEIDSMGAISFLTRAFTEIVSSISARVKHQLPSVRYVEKRASESSVVCTDLQFQH